MVEFMSIQIFSLASSKFCALIDSSIYFSNCLVSLKLFCISARYALSALILLSSTFCNKAFSFSISMFLCDRYHMDLEKCSVES